MKILLTDAGKRFNRDWIFRHFSYSFESGKSYAITGPNGSGKSTLLQVLSGGMMMSEGIGEWSLEHSALSPKHHALAPENVYKHISICAPYLELVEEMTLTEFLTFHNNFKPLLPVATINDIIKTINLEDAAGKQIRNFSSGMKQRVKLAQCIFSDTPVVLLDEPCTNLDTAGIDLYLKLINDYCKERLAIVSSNDKVEYGFCGEVVDIMDYKK